MFATRGISFQHRHLMKDIIKLLPHCKPGNKMERKENLFIVNEVYLVNHLGKRVFSITLPMFVRCARCHIVISAFYSTGDLKEICMCGFQIFLMDRVFDLMYRVVSSNFTFEYGVSQIFSNQLSVFFSIYKC